MEDVFFRASGQGINLTIFGKQGENKDWNFCVEKNEIILPDDPTSSELLELEQRREYSISEFEFSFEEALNKLDYSDWHLLHPEIVHPEIARFVLKEFTRRMNEYNDAYPPENSMDQFIRESRIKEWNAKAPKSE